MVLFGPVQEAAPAKAQVSCGVGLSLIWSGGGGIIDVCNDPDIFEKILVKAFVFEEEWGPT